MHAETIQAETEYWTCWKHCGSKTRWKRTGARTLTGAKRVATARTRDEWRDVTVHVGVTTIKDEYGYPYIQPISARYNHPGALWKDDPNYVTPRKGVKK